MVAKVMKLTKKPVEVEGIRFTGDNHDDCKAFVGKAWRQDEAGTPYIKTKEGEMRVKPNAMVVKGVADEFYAVDPAIVEDTFDIPEEATESLRAAVESHWNKAQRDEASESDWAMPARKKLRIDDEKHTKLAWDMVDRVNGATDEERATARRRILARAKKLGIDTSSWSKGKKALEAFETAQVPDPVFRMDAIPYLFNQLTEESTELGQASCKAQRFGIDSIDPFVNVSNRDKVREEYTDVMVMLQLIDEELVARGYQPLLLGAGGSYFRERMAKRIATLKTEYAAGRFTLPGEFADQA